MSRIDPSEDLFSLTPRFASSIADVSRSSISSTSTLDLSDSSFIEGTPVNLANATMGFSMFHGNITRRTGKKMTVYQLLLDAQLELKSEGDKITCSKAAKKRKKLCVDSTSLVGDVHGSGRSAYISSMEAAINSGVRDRIYKYFHDFCSPNGCSLQIDMNEFSADESIPVFRDIRGVDSIGSYFYATTQSMPDCIFLFWQKNITKNADGTKEVRAEFHMTARRLYEINVLENENVHEDVELAIFGLAALANGHAPVNPDTVICSNFPEYKDDADVAVERVAQTESDERSSSTPSPSSDEEAVSEEVESKLEEDSDGTASGGTLDLLSAVAASSSSAAKQKEADEVRDRVVVLEKEDDSPAPVYAINSAGQRCKVRNLDSMNIFVADSNVEFVIGARFSEPIEWNNKGTFTWTIDTDHKVTKMKMVYTQVGLGKLPNSLI